ncbi:addiction module protein [Gryllotalpicola ginsengisoli]|uniref:addiction module protein n=1 Tax=Gryllotalpicola ginsengisoli TaxID=444608 RepID=UPI0003B484A9|nr:addiction module protein [Gryllotalpicola ginsengisoli]
MKQTLAEYLEAGYALTPEERLEAARMLRQSVEQETDAGQAEIDAAWDEEISKRVAEVLDGSANLVDGPETLAQVRAELAARRK